jgi:hypothetical protein
MERRAEKEIRDKSKKVRRRDRVKTRIKNRNEW